MKKVLNRIGATVLSLALLVSLTPITGFAVIANEAEDTPAATEETEKSKDPGDSGAGKQKETKKEKESPKSEKETPKETKQTEAEAPKETEKKETEAPKESDKPETTTPKETKKPDVETPEETKAAEPETSKEPEATETEAPKETEATEPETSKEPETSETEAPKETEATEPETSKEPEESATEPSESEATEPETSETEETTEPTEPTESTEPEEAEGETDGNVSSGSKKTPVVVGDIDVSINSSGVMSWSAYSGATNYILFISYYNTATIDPASNPTNLKSTIDNLIRARELEKNSYGEYELTLEAYDSNGIMIANWNGDFTYKSSATAQTGTIQNIAFNDSTGILTWSAYTGATEYAISINDYDEDWVTTTSYSKLKATIDKLVKSGDISKPSDGKYRITVRSINKECETTAYGSITITYATQSNPVSWQPITGVDFSSNGVLTWDALSGATKYYVEIDCNCGYYTTSPKFALGAQIDKLVVLKTLSKSDDYWVGLSAYDEDNDYIGGWEGHLNYTPTTNPGSGTIANVKITKGILTWRAVSGASGYYVEIGDDYASVYVTANKTNLYAQVNYLIKTGDLTKSSNGRYTLTIYAEDYYGNAIATWTGAFTYKSTAVPISQGDIDNITFHTEGYMTWDAYKGASYYTLELDSVETFKLTGTRFEIAQKIDWYVKNGDFDQKTWYDVYLTAYDKTNVPLATGWATYNYKSSATPISRGEITGAKVTNGVLTWDKYSGAAKYAITVSNAQGAIPYVTGNTFKLSEYIYKLIATGNIWESGYYQVCITAIDSQGFFIAEKMIDYNYILEPNPLKTGGRTASVKYKKLKKKNQSVSRVKVIAVSGAAGKVTYKKIGGHKKIVINASTGKVTVKKKLKKGVYRVTVQVKAAGNAYYQASEVQTVTFTIRVK